MGFTKDGRLQWRLAGDLDNENVVAELVKEEGSRRGLWLENRNFWFWHDSYDQEFDKYFRASITPRYELREGRETHEGTYLLDTMQANEFRQVLLLPDWHRDKDPDEEDLRRIFIEGFLRRAAEKFSS